MDYPQEIIVKMINDLKKEKNVSAKEIEDLLEYSNGMIGKIKKGRTKMPEDKIGVLSKFYFDKMNEGKEVGYIKILSDGTVEMGIIENYATPSEQVIPPDELLTIAENATKGVKQSKEFKEEVWEVENPTIFTNDKPELADWDRKQKEQRIADIEEELKKPPKNPIVGLRTWVRVRQEELQKLKSELKS